MTLFDLLSATALLFLPCVIAGGTWPPDALRNLSIYFLAYKGTGKSRLMGRLIAKNDLLRGIPQLIIDAVGGTIDNLLDCILRLPPAERQLIWPRIKYFDMSGQNGYVCPLPLYYRLGEESWNDVAARYIHTILTLDPNLTTASIQGANAIFRLGIPTGILLAAGGWQISEARMLLDSPKLFKEWLKTLAAEAEDWGLRDAATFFNREYMGWDGKKRTQEGSSFRGKLNLLLRDNPTLAMFSAPLPGIDFNQVIKAGQTVILDFRGDQQNSELLRFKMLWCLYFFLNFIKHRGAGLHHQPIGLVIDEISILSSYDAKSGHDIFAAEIDALLNIWSRQGMVWVTLANQEMFQLSPRLFKTLMGCGTIVTGLTSDMEAATTLAQELIPAQPQRVKRHEPIYRSDNTIRGYRPVEFSLEEQTQLAATLFKTLPKFKFLVKEVGRLKLWELDTSTLDQDVYPDEVLVAEVRELLNKKCGTPISSILAQIEARQAELGHPAGRLPSNGSRQSVMLEENEQQPNHLPESAGGIKDDDFYT